MAVCTIPGCMKEFPTLSDMMAHKKDPKAVHSDPLVEKEKEIEKETSKIPPSLSIPPEPIQLVYSFRGMCPTCRKQVSTLPIEVDKKLVIVAFCTACNKQLQEKQVIPIEKQYEKKESINANSDA